MRARIRVADYDMEYAGPSDVWNDLLRPIFGGPPAEDGPPSAANGGEPRHPRSSDDEPHGASPAAGPPPPGGHDGSTSRGGGSESVYDALAAGGGRRAEKDVVLVAVWEAEGGRHRDVGFDEVARVVHAHAAFREVRVKPHLLKHISRTKMLEPGALHETVRLTAKGRRYVDALRR